MTKSIEQSVKEQFAKFFEQYDWRMFKETADYYFEFACHLLKKDIPYGEERYRLWRRNTTKRLYIGIGTELLLKAIFLKNNFCINTPQRGVVVPGSYPYSLVNLNRKNFEITNTLTLNQLIQKLLSVETKFHEPNAVIKGLNIAKVFRNKEGHVALYRHAFEPQNYTDIEVSLTDIYRTSFGEKLDIKIAFADGDKSKFSKNEITSG